ncbi:hypothetical protein HZD82_25190, partial [Pantoea agglomerans]|uniref:hypothetical protein n=1 Tax=Enterobacter agglomerans TaxID=549 RepID=UPI001A8E501E
ADTRSGVLALLRHTGFNLPVFVANAFEEEVMHLPGVSGELTTWCAPASRFYISHGYNSLFLILLALYWFMSRLAHNDIGRV